MSSKNLKCFNSPEGKYTRGNNTSSQQLCTGPFSKSNRNFTPDIIFSFLAL